MTLGGIGAFPNFRRARVVWIGCRTDPRLELLHHDLEIGVRARRPGARGTPLPAAHHPRARAHGTRRSDAPHPVSRGAGGAYSEVVDAATVDLMASELAPDGPRYRRLHSAPLARRLTMGHLRRVGCLVVLLIVAIAGWITRDRWCVHRARPRPPRRPRRGSRSPRRAPRAADRARRAADAARPGVREPHGGRDRVVRRSSSGRSASPVGRQRGGGRDRRRALRPRLGAPSRHRRR